MSDLYSELLVKKGEDRKGQAGKRRYHCTDRSFWYSQDCLLCPRF